MERLSKPERVIYYPATIALTMATLSLVSGTLTSGRITASVVLGLISLALWLLPFSKAKVADVVLRFLLLMTCIAFMFLMLIWLPWILGALGEALRR